MLWRLLVLIALIIGVRAVYAYLYLLMPKYSWAVMPWRDASAPCFFVAG